MCVIINTKRKDLLKERELRQAMKENPAGFFLAALYKDKNGKPSRDVIRTMDEKEAVDFWKKQPDDREMVMHFRIPSRGMDRTVDNVHGWEEDGIRYSHNMTIHEIDGMMSRVKWKGTDSEFFFRKVFIPMYRGLGGYGKAYADGKFCEDLDNIVEYFCGTSNRFCFIMPDNVVLRYGNWAGNEPSRKVGDEPGFFASNDSWRVYEPAWREKGGKRVWEDSRFRNGNLVGPQMGKATQAEEMEEEYELWPQCGYANCGYQADDTYPYPSARREEKPVQEAASGGEVLMGQVGVNGVLRIALTSMVVSNWWAVVKQFKLYGDDQEWAEKFVKAHILPSWISEEMGEVANEFLELASSGETADIVSYAEAFSSAAEKHLSKYFSGAQFPPQSPNAYRIAENVEKLSQEIKVFLRFSGCRLNFHAVTGEEFVRCFLVEESKRRHRPYVDELPPCDLIGGSNITDESAMFAVSSILRAIRWTEQGNALEDLDLLAVCP